MSSDTAHPRILITDDEKIVRDTLSRSLQTEGFDPLLANDGKTTLEIMHQELVDVLVLDIQMLHMNGTQCFDEVRKFDTSTPIIFITGAGAIEAAVEAMRKGAYSYLTKPINNGHLIQTIRRALEEKCLTGKNALSDPGEGQPFLQEDDHANSLQRLTACGPRMAEVLSGIRVVAPTDFTVLITGETGSGKELVARAIHQLGRRSSGPFVSVDCGSIPPGLIESELFGHEKGAFTSADRAHQGKFELAAGGTLFLDEISNLPLHVQPKLLRAIQEKVIWRVGGTKPLKIDMRVVAATNQDLAFMVHAKHFRRDLYHRLAEFGISVPPLRERTHDLVFLARYFLEVTNRELGKNIRGISTAALEVLLRHRWAGNVRELRNVVRRAVLLADTHIEPGHLGISPATSGAESSLDVPPVSLHGTISLKEIVRSRITQVEREVIHRVLAQTGGNKAKAARILQVDYKTMHKKSKEYAISLSVGDNNHEQRAR